MDSCEPVEDSAEPIRATHPPRAQSRGGLRAAVLLGVLLAAGPSLWGQSVALYLRNGDRLTGTILAETNNRVTLSTAWAGELTIPAGQIERRQALASLGSLAATNSPAAVPATASGSNNTAGAKSPAPLARAAVAPPPRPPWLKNWKGETSIGTDLLLGATDREDLYAHLNLTYTRPYSSDPKQFFRNGTTYNAEYGRTDGVLSANRMDGSDKSDLDVGKRFYVYNLGRAGYDEMRRIDLEYEEGPGLGYHLFAQTNFNLDTEMGADYQWQERSDNTTPEDFYYRLAEDLSWKISKQTLWTEKVDFFPLSQNPGEYRTRFESTLSEAFLRDLSLNLTVLDLFDTRPAARVPQNDFQIRTSLGFKF